MDWKIMADAVQARWRQRNRRERRLLAILGGALAFLLLVDGVWRPLHLHLAQQQLTVSRLNADLLQLERMRSEMQQWQSMQPIAPLSGDALLGVLQQQAQRQGFSLEDWRIEPSGRQLSLSGQADFDRWLLFAAALETQSHLLLTQLNVRAGRAPGQVSIDAVLRHGGE